jgi:hypothetical protein
MTEFWIWNLQTFVLKLVPEVEIWVKSGGHFITFSWIKQKIMRNLKTFHYFLYGIIKHSNKVWYPTCLEANIILILNFPRISAKYALKYQKRTIYYEFKQFWRIFNIFCVLCLCLLKIILLFFSDFKILVYGEEFWDSWKVVNSKSAFWKILDVDSCNRHIKALKSQFSDF